MRKFLGFAAILFAFNASAYEKLMNCEAFGALNGSMLFEVETEVTNAQLKSQGTSIVDASGEVVKKTSLMIISKDHFQNDFSIELMVTIGKVVVESEKLEGLSLTSGTKLYGISKNLGDYRMKLSCELL